MKKLILPAILCSTLSAGAQLYIDNATFFIDNGAVVTVQGDVFSNVNIQAAGTGKIRMGGTAAQNINLNGFDIPNLQIDNASASIVMTGAGRVTNTLEFTNGKIQLGNFDLTLAAAATYTGEGAGKFAETNGTGLFKKQITAAGNYILPIGTGTTYTPLQYQLTSGTYSSAFVAARAVAGSHPNKHPRSTDFLKSYWKLSNSGITGGTKVAVGTYVDPTGVTGVEADIRSMYWNGTTWVIGTSQDVAANTVTAPVTGATYDLYGMNKFILVSPKVFLQGPFNTTTGLMNDLLRNSTGVYSVGNLPASNVIPTSDPYRTATYSTAFTNVANPVAETVSTDVLKDLANPGDQIVDWVFVELRNKTSNTTAPVVQTRSVLLERDGDLVDIDGVSPVYFKNVDATSNYVITVRHRNHLAISSNPASALSLGLSSTTFNFTNTANVAAIFGTANTNYLNDGSRLLMYAGNANFNTRTSYNGSGNDASYILGTLLSGNPAGFVNAAYSQGDVNFNRRVSYSGSGNDASYILSTPLSGNPSGFKTDVRPN